MVLRCLLYQSSTTCNLRFRIATALAHVSKMLLWAWRSKCLLEAHGTRNVTHRMVSTPSSCRSYDPNATCSALVRLWQAMPHRHTLRVCSDIACRSLRRLCRSSVLDASNRENFSKRQLKSFERLCFWSTQVIARQCILVQCHQTQPT